MTLKYTYYYYLKLRGFFEAILAILYYYNTMQVD